MTETTKPLPRLFPAAALVAALALPITGLALAQDAAGEATAEAVADSVAEVVDTVEAAPTAGAAEAEPEKTPEELAEEAEKAELEALQREARMRQARLSAELAPLQEEKQRIEAELALLNTRLQGDHAEQKLANDRAEFQAQLAVADLTRQINQMKQQYQQMQVQNQMATLERSMHTAELSAANAKLAAQTAALQAELALLKAERSAASIDMDPMQYPAQPLDGKTLHVSDRRIPLNGAIGGGTADYVTERIHYFNNLDPEAPIFIVIDNSPGGSVMEGFRIVTAMQNSDAPVHVLVKSFAASMAAVITTLAEESYAYPNAVILHHQMSSSMRGNLTQQREMLEEANEWSDRLAVPVAEKMGVTYEQFVDLMYENNSDGDWAEFADKAKELKWVNHIVEEVRETALVSAPTSRRGGVIYLEADGSPVDSDMPRPLSQWDLFNSPIQFEIKTDGNGRAYTELPPLGPFDYYFMFDPDQRYRLAK